MPGSMNGPMLGPMLRPQSPVLGKCYVASEILYKIGDIWLEILKIKKSGISDLRDSKFQFGEGVTFLYKLFTKSVISGSKSPKSENLGFWDFGDPRILFWECIIFLYKIYMPITNFYKVATGALPNPIRPHVCFTNSYNKYMKS